MILEKTNIEDIILLTPRVYEDDRGYFMESYNQKKVEILIKDKFVQDNESESHKNVLRGLHFQLPPHAQSKLIRVIKGSILDIAVDLRKDSSTYGKHFKHILSGENKKQLYIPIGFAHGFLSLEDNTILNYKCSDYYNANAEASILWNDPDLAIDWGVENPILAEKDQLAENFVTFENPF
ncbi:dTDP-4-dehydrorhamnose 3,5-epimerase [Lutimonas halocynthiae]|uniref:dTDP-4-dehydrorhamnose 3,5-epimerase n=1 Tax=Lutimonas halocynthiae TaxID=1446477 RepID=UPI0025B384FC|nr:dTDP-4-dehydrorhamnose 3,5-epimerase [Lutimonas halocynthiae]MDN3644270.1 dTDP-4-dehydrorhamnose 3,5-epimerase [Lutimonas halocynthiae]